MCTHGARTTPRSCGSDRYSVTDDIKCAQILLLESLDITIDEEIRTMVRCCLFAQVCAFTFTGAGRNAEASRRRQEK